MRLRRRVDLMHLLNSIINKFVRRKDHIEFQITIREYKGNIQENLLVKYLCHRYRFTLYMECLT